LIVSRVAVIVPVLNEEDSIEELIAGLADQSRPPDEIVIGDGGSTDRTLTILEQLQATNPRLRIVTGPGGIAENRNAAIAATTSDVVACTDAGCVPEPRWLERLVAPFANGAEWVAGFYRPVGATTASTAAGAVMMTTEAEVNLDHFLPGGSSLAFLRSAWERAGGFPEGHGVGEDTLFGERLRALGYRPVFVPEAVVAWQPPPDLATMARKARTWGRADGVNQVRTGAYAKVLLAYWLFPVFIFLATLARRWLGSIGLAAYAGLVTYRTRHKYASVPSWTRFFWVPAAHIRQQMAASAGWIDGYGWRRLGRKVGARLGLRSNIAGRAEAAPVRHNVDLLVRSEREARHWLADLPSSYRVGAVSRDPELPFVTATLTPTRGEPEVAPVTVEYGNGAGPELKDPVARYEALRQSGRRYQLTPAPGGLLERADPINHTIAVVVLAAVPLHDVGGGSRGAQLAMELASRGIHVTYVHRFDAAESVDLGLRFIHPALEERRWNEFAVGSYVSRLNSSRRLTLVEFPHRDHWPVVQSLKMSGFSLAFDLIDDWADKALGGFWYEERIENEFIASADLLLASAPVLVATLKTRSQREVSLVPNAVNPELFDADKNYPRPHDLPAGRVIEYHGSLYGDWFAWEAVQAVALDNPEATVVLIGDPPAVRRALPPNVALLGLKPQEDLAAYLAHSDVALIPFVVSPTTHAVSPLKVYEYLAMGVPVAAPPLETLRGLDGVVCDDDLVAAVRRARTAPRPNPVAALVKHSWGARLATILEGFGLDLPAAGHRVRIEKRPVRRYRLEERLLTAPPSH